MLKLKSAETKLSEPTQCSCSLLPPFSSLYGSVESWGWGNSSVPGSLVVSWEEGRREGWLVQVLRAMETQMLAGPLGGLEKEGHQALKAGPS